MDAIIPLFKEKNKTMHVPSAVSETLSEAVIKNMLPKNYRIKEEELAKMFNVSRTPVREALNALMKRGLIVSDSKNGYTIKEFSTNEANNIIRYTHVLRRESASLAARYATQGQIAILENSTLTNEKLELLKDCIDAQYTAFQKFNLLVAKYSNNKYIYSESLRLHEKLLLIHYFYTEDVKYDHPMTDFAEESIKVFEAISNHDPKAAREAVEKYDDHIYRVTRHMYNLCRDYE